jgi:iron complex transport system substrate-binding protein
VRHRFHAAALVSVAVLASGCGERSEPVGELPQTYPVVVRGAGDRPTVASKAPERIVALDPGSAELIAALGAGKRLVGVPADVDVDATEVVSSIGRVNVDAVVRLEPDLVVGTPSTDPLDLTRAARESGAISYVQPAGSIGDVERGAIELGFLLDAAPEARRLVADIRRRSAVIESRVSSERAIPTFIDTGFLITVGERSFAGDLVRRAQGRNVAGANPGPEPFQPCQIVRLGARVVLVVAERRQRTPSDEFRSCPGGRRVKLVTLDPALVLRAGPNVPAALDAVARALHPNAFR